LVCRFGEDEDARTEIGVFEEDWLIQRFFLCLCCVV
jgi:hypothetical protein